MEFMPKNAQCEQLDGDDCTPLWATQLQARMQANTEVMKATIQAFTDDVKVMRDDLRDVKQCVSLLRGDVEIVKNMLSELRDELTIEFS